jgi:hypothetical protein
MRVALIASPFISVPPTGYGGTELFIANLAEALARLNVKVDVYANGESRVKAVLHARHARQDWPLSSENSGFTKDIDHIAWGVDDAEVNCDIIHVSSAPAVPFSRFSSRRISLRRSADQPRLILKNCTWHWSKRGDCARVVRRR